MLQKLIQRVKNGFSFNPSPKQYHLAQKAYQEGLYFQAIALYRTCLALKENNSDELYCNLADSYYHLGLFSIAKQTIEKLRDVDKFSDEKLVKKICENAYKGNEGLLTISHHTYIRLKILSDQIRELYSGNLSGIRLLDIGGGAGYLACFLPEVQYVLVEPSVNGLSGLDMPFLRKSFDCVVACHVLEHIDESAKISFLDNLCGLARMNVIILNPFQVGDSYLDGIADADLQMIWEITGAEWAKDHIDSGVPALRLIKEYALSHQYKLDIVANNSHLFTSLYVYMEHFSILANKHDEFQKINKAFNCIDPKLMSNTLFPNDYMCVLQVHDISAK